MKSVCMILLVAASIIAATYTGAMARQTSLAPAATFPYDIVAEQYVPSLYYSVEPIRDERLVAVADFPSDAWGYCYCPSLYYEAWKITAVQAMK